MPTPNNASDSTVENVSGSGARGTVDTSYAAKSNIPRERVVKGHKSATRNSVCGFLNRRFKLSFWVLLGQRPKVPRAGARNTKKRADMCPLFSYQSIKFYPSRLSSPPSLVPCSGILEISVRYSRRKNASVTNSDATSARGKHHHTRSSLPMLWPYRAST